jgi:hypothetical protein
MAGSKPAEARLYAERQMEELAKAELLGGSALEPYMQFGSTPEERSRRLLILAFNDKYVESGGAAEADALTMSQDGVCRLADGTECTRVHLAQVHTLSQSDTAEDRQVLAEADATLAGRVREATVQRLSRLLVLSCSYPGCSANRSWNCTRCGVAGYCTTEHANGDYLHQFGECGSVLSGGNAGEADEWVDMLNADDVLLTLASCSANMKANRVRTFRKPKCAHQGCSVKQGLSKCTGCEEARYCSRTCQAADWRPRHKDECKFIAMAKVKIAKMSEESRRPPP